MKLVDDDTILSETDVDNYLVTNFLPFVLSMYTNTMKAHTSFEEFFRLLVKAIIKLGLKKDKVYKLLTCVLHICHLTIVDINLD